MSTNVKASPEMVKFVEDLTYLAESKVVSGSMSSLQLPTLMKLFVEEVAPRTADNKAILGPSR